MAWPGESAATARTPASGRSSLGTAGSPGDARRSSHTPTPSRPIQEYAGDTSSGLPKIASEFSASSRGSPDGTGPTSHERIEEGRDGLDTDDAASVRTLLDRVGDPIAIAAEAGAPPPGAGRWDAWAPWLIIFGFVASGLGWIAGVLILWTSPTWSQRDKLIGTFVPLGGLVALFFGLVAALHAAASCPGPAACTTKGVTLPLGVAIPLIVVGLAAHLLPPIHLMRTRRQRISTFV